MWIATPPSVSSTPLGVANLRRSRLRSSPTMIRMPAPAVKPITTESDTKLTSMPRRTTPIASRKVPTITASRPAAARNSAVPGAAIGSSVESARIEEVLVGPLCSWFEEPHSAPTIAATIAEYSPISGGRPASSANTIACGSSTTPTVAPAIRSPRRLAER